MPKLKVFNFSNVHQQEQSLVFYLPDDVKNIILSFLGYESRKSLLNFALSSKKSYQKSLGRMHYFFNQHSIKSLSVDVQIKLVCQTEETPEKMGEVACALQKKDSHRYNQLQATLDDVTSTSQTMDESRKIIKICQLIQSIPLPLFFGAWSVMGACALFMASLMSVNNEDHKQSVKMMMASLGLLMVAMICCLPMFCYSCQRNRYETAKNEQATHLRNFGTFAEMSRHDRSVTDLEKASIQV